MPLATIIAVVLGVPLAGLAWHLVTAGLGLGADFVIRSKSRGRVEVRGRIPRSKMADIKDFCTRNLESHGAFMVCGTWGPGRTLRIRCTGRLTPAERQRVRNYLMQCLG